MAPEELLVESLNGEFMLDPDPQHCFFSPNILLGTLKKKYYHVS